jgi:hypothetical protein
VKPSAWATRELRCCIPSNKDQIPAVGSLLVSMAKISPLLSQITGKDIDLHRQLTKNELFSRLFMSKKDDKAHLLFVMCAAPQGIKWS